MIIMITIINIMIIIMIMITIIKTIMIVTLNSPTPHSLEQTDSKTSACKLEEGWNCAGLIIIMVIINDHNHNVA